MLRSMPYLGGQTLWFGLFPSGLSQRYTDTPGGLTKIPAMVLSKVLGRVPGYKKEDDHESRKSKGFLSLLHVAPTS